MEAVGTTHTQHNFYTNTQQQQQQYQNEHFIQSKETTYTNVNTMDKQIHCNYGVHTHVNHLKSKYTHPQT